MIQNISKQKNKMADYFGGHLEFEKDIEIHTFLLDTMFDFTQI